PSRRIGSTPAAATSTNWKRSEAGRSGLGRRDRLLLLTRLRRRRRFRTSVEAPAELHLAERTRGDELRFRRGEALRRRGGRGHDRRERIGKVDQVRRRGRVKIR